MRVSFVVILFSLLAACTSSEELDANVGYFDLEKYTSEFAQSAQPKLTVSKTVKLNEVEETKVLKDYDISPELALMNKYNINKVSLAGKYAEKVAGNTTIYTALEEDLITRKLTIEHEADGVTRIAIDGLQKSVLSESTQTIIFEPKISFTLISEDINRYSKDLKKEVLITYLNQLIKKNK